MFENCISLLNSVRKIAVFTHVNPDGDALGSSVAFKLGLEQLNKTVDLYCDDIIHENYHFLKTKEYFISHNETKYDLAVVLDCPEISRIGKYSTIFKSTPKKLVIDHHLNNSFKADIIIVDEKAGSVGVLIFRLFNEMKIALNKEIASAIYTAVASDTGCFIHNNTTSESHLIAAELMQYNIDLENINFYLFKRRTKGQIALFNRILSNLQFHENNKIVIATINKEDFEKTNTTYSDTLGIQAYISGIDGAFLSILVTETQDNCYLVSFRSNKINTSIIAGAFQGGGHANASGCRIYGKKEHVINKLLEMSKKELK